MLFLTETSVSHAVRSGWQGGRLEMTVTGSQDSLLSFSTQEKKKHMPSPKASSSDAGALLGSRTPTEAGGPT